MAGRRDQVLDAAIDVLATAGARGLTYQAVDGQAGVPAGTTSNYFRNRAALIDGVVEYLAELDRTDLGQLAGPSRPISPEEFVTALAGVVRQATGPGRARTTARYVLVLEAVARPATGEALARGRATIVEWGAAWLAEFGSPAPAEHAKLLTDYMDGAMLHQLTFPSPDFEPEPAIRTILAALIG